MASLSTEGLGKRYGDTWAVRDVDLDVDSGVLGLLGPNGAGKSTLMRLLVTVTAPTEGSIRWKGTDAVAHPETLRDAVGYLPQDVGVYPNLTAAEFLSYLAAIRGVSDAADRIDGLLRLVNLEDSRDRRLGDFSGGMRQRVGIAQALLSDPSLLVVDEPTVGLDPEERVRFRNALVELAGDRVVVLSTHIVSDVEATADDVAIMRDGRLLRRDRPEALLRQVDGAVWEWTVPGEAVAAVKRDHVVSGTVRRPDGVRVRAVAEKRPDPDAEAVEPDLEDAYLQVLGGTEHR